MHISHKRTLLENVVLNLLFRPCIHKIKAKACRTGLLICEISGLFWHDFSSNFVICLKLGSKIKEIKNKKFKFGFSQVFALILSVYGQIIRFKGLKLKRIEKGVLGRDFTDKFVIKS